MIKSFGWVGMILIFILGGCRQGAKTDEDTVVNSAVDLAQYLEDYLPPLNPWGMLNQRGQVVIGAEYDALGEFSQGLCAANKQGLWGYIDRSGAWVIEPQYKGAAAFSEDWAAVWLFGHHYNFINRQGVLLTQDSIWEEVGNFALGRAKVRIGDYWGYVDCKGALIIPAHYDQIDDFKVTGARVQKDGKWRLIDSLGNLIIPGTFSAIKQMQNGWIITQDKGLWSILGAAQGSQYTQILEGDTERTYARKGDAWMLINQQGQLIQAVSFRPVAYLGEKRWALVHDGKFGLSDDNGQVVLPSGYDQINGYAEGLAAFRSGYDWGYLDLTGKVVIQPQFGLAWDFKEGLARVAWMKGMYFINHQGEKAFESRFHEFRDFQEGLCKFQSLQ